MSNLPGNSRDTLWAQKATRKHKAREDHTTLITLNPTELHIVLKVCGSAVIVLCNTEKKPPVKPIAKVPDEMQ